QQKIINGWYIIATKIYNKCVDKYRESKVNFELNFMKLKKEIINSLSIEDRQLCPYNIMSYEVKIFCENVKSCITQIKNRNIKHYEFNYKNTKKHHTITIEKKNINKNGFY